MMGAIITLIGIFVLKDYIITGFLIALAVSIIKKMIKGGDR